MIMRGNYSCRFSVFSTLGVFQTPNRLPRDYTKKDTASSRCLREFESGFFISVVMRGNYSYRFSVSSALGVKKTPNRLF